MKSKQIATILVHRLNETDQMDRGDFDRGLKTFAADDAIKWPFFWVSTTIDSKSPQI